MILSLPGSEMGNGTGIPGLETGIRNDSIGTLGTGTNIAGTAKAQDRDFSWDESYG